MRAPWNDPTRVEKLLKWWKHFGTYHMAAELGLSRSQVKGKVNKLKLKLLPKKRRLCVACRRRFQTKREFGLSCRLYHLEKRRGYRYRSDDGDLWIARATNTVRYRSKEPSDLTTEFMLDLWEKQGGRCAYSGVELKAPNYNSKRDKMTASIDRIDSRRGYIKTNVAWVAWGVNHMKSDLSLADFVGFCKVVTSNIRLVGDVSLVR